MTISVIERLAASFTDATLPKLVQDPLINAGSKFLFDFVNPFCNKNADGALAAGATFVNLVDGAAVATVAGTALSSLTGKAGIGFTGAGNTSSIQLGPTYDNSSLNHEMLVIYWMKLPSSGYLTSNFIETFANSSGNANASQWWFDQGSGGVQPRFVIGEGGSSSQNVNAPGITPGSVVQLAGHWVPGSKMEIYVNGALATSLTSSIPSTLQAQGGGAPGPILSNTIKATVYRCYMEDIAVSSASVAAQVAADYSTNSSRFT